MAVSLTLVKFQAALIFFKVNNDEYFLEKNEISFEKITSEDLKKFIH